MELLNEKDILTLSKEGKNPDILNDQIERFKTGFKKLHLDRPATLNDGILHFSDKQIDEFIQRHEKSRFSKTKFVPASGAATRVFKHLFEFQKNYDSTHQSYVEFIDKKGLVYDFFEHLANFPFYKKLNDCFFEKHKITLSQALSEKRYIEVIDLLLSKNGLNFAQLPKGLLPFHVYDQDVATPVEEHLLEALEYLPTLNQSTVHIHFTVSSNHIQLFADHIQSSIVKLNHPTDISFSYSTQNSATDTLVMTDEEQLLRDENEALIFRPAGHGALLENLNSLDFDIIFLKNIDNVTTKKMNETTIRYKKALSGILIYFQEKIFDILNRYEKGENVSHQGRDLLIDLGLKGSFSDKEVINYLHRPLRVCGMVKNEGEPGGGPFWVKDSHGLLTLQIVESAQIDDRDKGQLELLKRATHFNPVDIVCAKKDFKGKPFNLLNYRDPDTGFITKKSYQGKIIKSMELPGLWNGGMSYWNTVFVEVPLTTFNPVKTINDLLKPQHQP